MTSGSLPSMIDAPMALYLVWVAFSVALVVVGAIWIFRPAVALQPFKRLGIFWVLLTIIVGVVTWHVFSPNRPVGPRLAKAPNFAFRTVDGQSFSRDGLRGKVVLIEFWASWCGPCREALPEMLSLYKEFKDSRFVMIGISEDEDQAKFEAFVAQEGIRWPQDWDPDGKLASRFSTNAIPSYAVIDSDGRMRFMQKGYNGETYSRIRQAILDSLGGGNTKRMADAQP